MAKLQYLNVKLAFSFLLIGSLLFAGNNSHADVCKKLEHEKEEILYMAALKAESEDTKIKLISCGYLISENSLLWKYFFMAGGVEGVSFSESEFREVLDFYYNHYANNPEYSKDYRFYIERSYIKLALTYLIGRKINFDTCDPYIDKLLLRLKNNIENTLKNSNDYFLYKNIVTGIESACLFKDKKYAESKKILLNIESMYKDEKNNIAPIYSNLALLSYKMNNYDEAINYINKFLDVCGNSVKCRAEALAAIMNFDSKKIRGLSSYKKMYSRIHGSDTK